jgi:hypothetical protein
MSKPTKVDADTWQYAGFTINRCTHSRTFLATRPDGTKTYVRDRLRDVVVDIDCWHWKQWDERERASSAVNPEPEPVPAPAPTLAGFLSEWGLELVSDANGIQRHRRDNVEVFIDTVYGGVEIVVWEQDSVTEKRRLVLPGGKWPVHAAAEVVRAVLRERHA